jgi:hypothetical protein
VDYFVAIVGGRPDDRPVYVKPRRDIEDEPTVAVRLGVAPDGLPLVLQLNRQASIAADILYRLGVANLRDLPEDIREAVVRLDEAVRVHARRRGIVEAAPPRVKGSSYVSTQKVADLVGPSMLARALGPQSPLVIQEDLARAEYEPERMADTRALARAKDPVTTLKKIGGKRRLGLPCGDGQPWVVEWEPGKDAAPTWVRAFLFESIAHLKPARYHWRANGIAREAHLSDGRAYLKTVREADAIHWSLPRTTIGEALAQLADSIEDVHRKGRVHGDLKPQNSLLLQEGAWPFDSLDLKAGDLSPAATPGWAAPEQVLGREVSPATDVYALGLMTASLIGAAIYGEERTFIIPTGGSKRRRLRLLVSSDVYIDTVTQDVIAMKGAKTWQELLARAVCFDPEKRFPSAGGLAATLRQALKDHPPAGALGIRSGPGELRRNIVIEGELQPAWVVVDG